MKWKVQCYFSSYPDTPLLEKLLNYMASNGWAFKRFFADSFMIFHLEENLSDHFGVTLIPEGSSKIIETGKNHLKEQG